MTDREQDHTPDGDDDARMPELTPESLKDLEPSDEEAEAAKGGGTFACWQEPSRNLGSSTY